MTCKTVVLLWFIFVHRHYRGMFQKTNQDALCPNWFSKTFSSNQKSQNYSLKKRVP